jgi:hypothetical protein
MQAVRDLEYSVMYETWKIALATCYVSAEINNRQGFVRWWLLKSDRNVVNIFGPTGAMLWMVQLIEFAGLRPVKPVKRKIMPSTYEVEKDCYDAHPGMYLHGVVTLGE